jgi:hypothetical protein
MRVETSPRLIRAGSVAGFSDFIARRRNLARSGGVSDSVNSSRGPAGDGSRTLESVAVTITALLVAHALSAELEPLWQALRQLVGY